MRFTRSLVPWLCCLTLAASVQGCVAAIPVVAAVPTPSPATATTIVVVRHAERDTDDPRDPSLSAAGRERARALSVALAGAGVTDVYVTQYKRTRQTAEPLAQQRGITIVERPVDAANSTTYARDLAREILSRNAGKSVLVVGHSNTVPDIVAALSGVAVPPMADADYDRVFVVTIPASGPARLMQLRFGQSAGAP